MKIVETKRLIILQFNNTDTRSLIRILGDDEVMRFSDGVKNAQDIEEWLTHHLREYSNQKGTGPWAVIEKPSLEVIGYCGLFFLPDVCGQPETEIGYRFTRQYWGHGYATEATRAVLDYALNNLGITRLIALIDPGNLASIRVAEKIGMILEKDVLLPGYTHPDYVYAIER